MLLRSAIKAFTKTSAQTITNKKPRHNEYKTGFTTKIRTINNKCSKAQIFHVTREKYYAIKNKNGIIEYFSIMPFIYCCYLAATFSLTFQ